MRIPSLPRRTLPLLLVGIVLLLVGLWGLDLQAKQARDTTRKLDLEDLETALTLLLRTNGTVPPADRPTWCGVMNVPANADVRAVIEQALRTFKKYERAEKPFPADPRWAGTERDYAYWKTSPATFELLTHLEADDNDSRPLDLTRCALRGKDEDLPMHSPTSEVGPIRRSPANGRDEVGYDYAIQSFQRQPL